MTPEFSRTVRIDTLGSAPRNMAIEAAPEEREAIARRFGLLSVGRLSAEVRMVRTGEAVKASGRLEAEVDQPCVATGEPVGASMDEPFDIVFRPHPEAGPDAEVELGEDEMDVVFYDGAMIDIGEAVAETLSLALDPYPRSAAADATLKEAGVIDEEEALEKSGPFAGLAALRDKLTG